jgi:hypothetical protein
MVRTEYHLLCAQSWTHLAPSHPYDETIRTFTPSCPTCVTSTQEGIKACTPLYANTMTLGWEGRRRSQEKGAI